MNDGRGGSEGIYRSAGQEQRPVTMRRAHGPGLVVAGGRGTLLGQLDDKRDSGHSFSQEHHFYRDADKVISFCCVVHVVDGCVRS